MRELVARLARAVGAWVPDATAAAALMIVLLAGGALALARLVMPRAVHPLSAFPEAQALGRLADTAPVGSQPASTVEPGFGSWSERTRVFPILLAVILGGWLWHHFVVKQLGLDLNSMVTLLLLIAVLMQPNLAAIVGATPQQGLLALGIGDQTGNLLSPFWMVVAGIARVDFRRLYGYALVFGLPWFVLRSR